VLAGIKDAATVGSLWFAARTFGVQLQAVTLHTDEALVLIHSHQTRTKPKLASTLCHADGVGIGCSSYSLPSRPCQNPCRTLALSQRLEYSARSPTSTAVGCADVITCTLGGCAQGIAISVHLFVIAGDVEYASVLVDTGCACFAGSCKHSWGSCTLVWVRDKH